MRPPLPVALLSCVLCLGVGYALAANEQASTEATPVADEFGSCNCTAAVTAEPAPAAPAQTSAGGVAEGDTAGRPLQLHVQREVARPPAPAPDSSRQPGATLSGLELRLDLERSSDLQLLVQWADVRARNEETKPEAVRLLEQVAASRHPLDAHLLAVLCQHSPELGLPRFEAAVRRQPDLLYAYVSTVMGLSAQQLPADQVERARGSAVALLERSFDRLSPELAQQTSLLSQLARLAPERAFERFQKLPRSLRDANALETMADLAAEVGRHELAFEWGVAAAQLDPRYAAPPPAHDLGQLRQLEALEAQSPSQALRRALAASYGQLNQPQGLAARIPDWKRRCTPDELVDLVNLLHDYDREEAPELTQAVSRLAEAAVRTSPWDEDPFYVLAEVDPGRALQVLEELERADPRLVSAHSDGVEAAFYELALQAPAELVALLSRSGARVKSVEEWQSLVEAALEAEDEVNAKQLHRLGRARFPELPAYEELAGEGQVGSVVTFD